MWGANLYASSLPVGSWLVWDKRASDGSSFLADAEVAWKKHGYGVYIKSINQQQQASKLKNIAHPTKKPVELFAWCIEQAKDSKTVFDPYLGSGTTLIAAEQLGRKCYGMEISPAYCDVIVKRWETLTGRKAELAKT
jgi:DNA modification methylase